MQKVTSPVLDAVVAAPIARVEIAGEADEGLGPVDKSRLQGGIVKHPCVVDAGGIGTVLPFAKADLDNHTAWSERAGTLVRAQAIGAKVAVVSQSGRAA